MTKANKTLTRIMKIITSPFILGLFFMIFYFTPKGDFVHLLVSLIFICTSIIDDAIRSTNKNIHIHLTVDEDIVSATLDKE